MRTYQGRVYTQGRLECGPTTLKRQYGLQVLFWWVDGFFQCGAMHLSVLLTIPPDLPYLIAVFEGLVKWQSPSPPGQPMISLYSPQSGQHQG
jgi:hypothetical protein